MFEPSALTWQPRPNLLDEISNSIDIYEDNRQLHGHEAEVMMEKPETTISVLLREIAHLRIELREAKQARDSHYNTAAKNLQKTLETQRRLDDLICNTADVQRQWRAIKDIVEPLKRVAEHSKSCQVGDICRGHHDMSAAASAILSFIKER
jgi:hypothetical protein